VLDRYEKKQIVKKEAGILLRSFHLGPFSSV
jgi:hypothetical protein